ncbi:MAG TPA: MogA/MoaB family molybdenum cofactor biosynthesis protein [Syntrophorhabdaceae bacterium]|nr:MogA/MoaB family molybdenum cofactor biosynthesis protein [Syntrophorhabdaceae bacterium]
MSYRVQVITVSDKGSRGDRVDTSGPAIKKMLEKDFIVGDVIIVPDEADIIADAMKRAIDEEGMDMVVTTGGTGLSARDVTPEATRSVIERDLPGFAEVMRLESYRITPRAIISRAVCGIRRKSIIINLPGSEKAAVECLGFVIGAIPHALAKLKGDAADCGA